MQQKTNAPVSKKTAAQKTSTPVASTANTLTLQSPRDKSEARIMAECALSPVAANASTARIFAQGTFGESGITDIVSVMREKAAKVQSGDLSEVEATLTAQAATLDAMFNELARRAALNMGTHLQATDTYLRQAFKAQAQCRSTLEALAEIKNPRPVAFVKQANIAHGPQQVNNGTRSSETRAHENHSIQSNKLSGDCNELLPDSGASRITSRVNQKMEAVGEIHRATD